ncbi:MAG: histidine kinase, partial [Verrucomicrobiota bacterium]
SWFFYGLENYPLAYLPFPFLVWLALTGGLPMAALGILGAVAGAVAFSSHGAGPFAGGTPLANFAQIELYIGIFATTGLLLGAGAEAQRREKELRAVAATREAEMERIKAQIHPHFLFNSLNGIATEIPTHPDSATEMVRELSDYLRYSLDHRKRAVGPLSDELDAMRAYLEIEKARFGERLSVRIEATAEARCKNVPSFLLQPLVENAVKHGLSISRHPMELTISASVLRDRLIVEVTNTGTLPDPDPSKDGLGLDTLRRRLDLNYPRRHEFTLAAVGGRVQAKILLRGEPCFA